MRLTLDLHDVYNRGWEIDRALRTTLEEAERSRASVLEIIPGKGSGQLKKHVLRFLEQPEVRVRYHRIEKDSRNFGRVLVHFRWIRGVAGSAPPARGRRGHDPSPATPAGDHSPASARHSRRRTPASGR